MPRISYYSLSEISSHLSSWRRSGGSVSSYCKTHDIPTSTFHGWKKRHNEDDSTIKQGTTDFVEVSLASLNPKKSSIKLSRTEIEIPTDIGKELITILKSFQV